MRTGEIEPGDRPETPIAFKALTRLNELERRALKVALVRFVSEHPGFGASANLTMRTAASGPENLAAYADRAYRDLLELRRADLLPFSDGAAILILQHLGKLHDASDGGGES